MITSTANPRIKAVAQLSSRSHREATSTFPIEGLRMVARALGAGWPLTEVLIAPEIAPRAADEIESAAMATGVQITEVGVAAFGKMSYRSHPDGVLAIGRMRHTHLDDLSPLPADSLLLVVEAIEKPGNLGAMLRTADAAGVTAVIAADPATDRYNPNVVRASQGSLFTVPFAAGTAGDVRTWLESNEVTAHTASPETGAHHTNPWDADLTGSVAVVIGSEHAGLSAAWAGCPTVTIPTTGTADSLNASTAAGVILFEAVRQRSPAPGSSGPG